MFDVAVVGLGPAGRALADRCADQGLSVLAVDPAPDARWRQTLCLWRDQVPPWIDGDVVAVVVDGPVLRARTDHRVHREYVVLDNAALRRHLPLDGPSVTVEKGTVDDPATLLDRAHRVVDCRGHSTATLGGGVPTQTAYGLVLPTDAASAALMRAPALFMDWTDDHGDTDDIGPTFLYAVPLGDGRTLLEETCLAGDPAPTPERLGRRLRSRLRGRGVPEAAMESPLAVEEVRIPLLPPPPPSTPGVEAFGTAGGYGHSATGFSVAASLSAAPVVARALATGTAVPPPRPEAATLLHRRGLDALLGSDQRTVVDLFESFGTASDTRQRAFLDSARPSRQVLAAMIAMGVRMPPRSMVRLAVSAVRPGPGGAPRDAVPER